MAASSAGVEPTPADQLELPAWLAAWRVDLAELDRWGASRSPRYREAVALAVGMLARWSPALREQVGRKGLRDVARELDKMAAYDRWTPAELGERMARESFAGVREVIGLAQSKLAAIVPEELGAAAARRAEAAAAAERAAEQAVAARQADTARARRDACAVAAYAADPGLLVRVLQGEPVAVLTRVPAARGCAVSAVEGAIAQFPALGPAQALAKHLGELDAAGSGPSVAAVGAVRGAGEDFTAKVAAAAAAVLAERGGTRAAVATAGRGSLG